MAKSRLVWQNPDLCTCHRSPRRPREEIHAYRKQRGNSCYLQRDTSLLRPPSSSRRLCLFPSSIAPVRRETTTASSCSHHPCSCFLNRLCAAASLPGNPRSSTHRSGIQTHHVRKSGEQSYKKVTASIPTRLFFNYPTWMCAYLCERLDSP